MEGFNARFGDYRCVVLKQCCSVLDWVPLGEQQLISAGKVVSYRAADGGKSHLTMMS